MNCHESNVKKVMSQDNAEEKKNANLNLYRKLPKRSKCGAFQPIIQKFHLSKIKKKESDRVVVTCGALLFCIYLHGNLSALRKWCSELFGTV